MLGDLARPRDLSPFAGRGGTASHRERPAVSGDVSRGGASSITVSWFSFGVSGSLLGESAGDCELLLSLAKRAPFGSRGTSDLGGWALRIGGSSDSDRASAGRWRDFLICSLSCSRSCRTASSSILISSGLADDLRSRDLVLLLLRRRLLSRAWRRSRDRSRSGVLLRLRPPRYRLPRSRACSSSSCLSRRSRSASCSRIFFSRASRVASCSSCSFS